MARFVLLIDSPFEKGFGSAMKRYLLLSLIGLLAACLVILAMGRRPQTNVAFENKAVSSPTDDGKRTEMGSQVIQLKEKSEKRR
jgi:hypothetical protein